MFSGFIGQFTGLLVHPRSTLASLKQAPLRSAFTYFLAVWAVFAVLFCLVGWRLNFNSRSLDPWLLVQFAILVLCVLALFRPSCPCRPEDPERAKKYRKNVPGRPVCGHTHRGDGVGLPHHGIVVYLGTVHHGTGYCGIS